jgi:hypothetical protein
VNKRKFIYIVSGVIFVLIAVFIYLSYFSQPSSFLKEEQLIEEINISFPRVNAIEVQGVFDISEKHKYVPFISSEDNYGKSFWVWDKYKWRLVHIDTKGEPKIWKVNKRDPASYHIVWNIHPDDQIMQAKFYMIRDRGYSTTGGIDRKYYPRVQVNHMISMDEQPYGVLKVPNEWAAFVTSINETQSVHSNGFFDHFPAEHQVYFSWMPLNEENELTYAKKSLNGSSNSNSDIGLEFVFPIDAMDIERSGE